MRHNKYIKKYRIYVYAICKNEEKFVERWVNSMKEADGIFVLDTGSTDKTVKKLKSLNVKVKTKKIDAWRFDVARNKSLDLVPIDADICVCTDLDEVFEKGWRKKLEEIWNDDITRIAYNYNWLLDDNNPKVNFYIEKIHKRFDYKWIHPVHEVLQYIGDDLENKIYTDEITLNHYPDNNKSRESYLPLLELSVKENPDDDRNVHYLGREYMYYGRWNECIDTLIKHLKLPTSTWRDERCASMRFIARSYKYLNRYDEARMWLDKAIPYLRDPYVERALLEYVDNNYEKVIEYCNKALSIKTHTKSYINEIFSWDHTIYDLLSIAYFNINNIEKSLICIDKAIKLCTDKNEKKRLLTNKEIIKNKQKSSKN